MRIEDALHGVTRLAIDTAPILYFVEANPRYDEVVTTIFQRIATGELFGSTSTLTLTEVLVHPFRQNARALQQQYRELLTTSEHFELQVIDAATAERAAELRAQYNLRTPDAIQVSAAISASCQAFLTNALALKSVAALRIITLEELLTSQ